MNILKKIKFSRKVFVLGVIAATWLEVLWQMAVMPFAQFLDLHFSDNLEVGFLLLDTYLIGCNLLCLSLFVCLYIGRAADIGISLKYAIAILIGLLWFGFYSRWLITFCIWGMIIFTLYLLVSTGKSDDSDIFNLFL